MENEIREASPAPNIALVFESEDKLGVRVDDQKSLPVDTPIQPQLDRLIPTTQQPSQRGRKVFRPSEIRSPLDSAGDSWKNTGEEGEKVYEVRVTKAPSTSDRTPFPTRRRTSFTADFSGELTAPTFSSGSPTPPPVIGGFSQQPSQQNSANRRPISIADRINLTGVTSPQLTNFPSLNPSQASELSGQLIIYDIDEEPPNLQQVSKSSIGDI